MVKKRVLIVEDDVIISSFIQLKLEEMGYIVPVKARGGNEAIEMARKYQPDLILMDVMLEGEIDGIQAVEEITKTLDIPVIYLTASSDENTISRLMKTEPHGFLIKPFDDRILSSAIHIAVYRHKTKKELFDTKEMLRSTIESIDDLVFSLDAQGVFTHNHSGNKHRLHYLNAQSIVGKNLKEVFPDSVAKQLQESIQSVIDYQKPHSVEFWLEDHGMVYWFSSQLTLRQDEKGKMPVMTMVLSDITERKNMYQELLVSQEKLSEAQNIARLGSCDVFFKEKKLVYNDLYFELLDVVDEERINNFNEERMLEIIHPDDRSRYKLFKKQILEEKRKDFSIDYRVLDRQANVRHIHSVGQLKFDNDGEIARMIITLQDISWQKTSEKLRHDVELARQSAEMKQKFFARLSHEIRNPVCGITGLLHLLERSDLDSKQRDYIQALKTTSDTLLNLLNDVLDFSKIESGMMKIKPSEFEIRKTIKNLHTFFSPNAQEKNLDFSYIIQDDLPERIVADENKIVQVLSNLLSNAFKFTGEGHVQLRLSFVKKDDEELTLRFEIEDSGAGISKENQKALFKDYSQLDNDTFNKIKGSGLGLSICKQLVELMGGEIAVKSQSNEQGSIFWFYLPVLAAAGQMESMAQKGQKTTPVREKLDCSILLVEDMLVNQKVIKIILEDMGCKVTLASNGQQAIEMYKETVVNAFDIFARIHYDIILMDHMMPVMDGLTALKKLKSDYDKLPPVIVLTADETFGQNEKYKKNGFDDCIIKPVNAEELYVKLKEHLSKTAPKTVKQKLELFSLEDVEKRPVINTNTIDLIMGHAKQNNFNIELLFDSFFEDMERIYNQSLSAIEMNDYNALKLIVMTVKGLSGNIGASQVHATAKLMDRYIRNEQFEEASALFPLLTEKYSIFKNKIETDYISSFVEK